MPQKQNETGNITHHSDLARIGIEGSATATVEMKDFIGTNVYEAGELKKDRDSARQIVMGMTFSIEPAKWRLYYVILCSN